MKAKSMKLRTLITLLALWKHTDEDHRLNTKKLNEYLRPYHLDCTGRVLADTVRILREFGIDVRNRGEWEHQGVWLADRPLQDEALEKLIFAVSTNPYIPKEQASEILASLLPLVTAYQEEKLTRAHEAVLISDKALADSHLHKIYSVIREAISKGRRVIFHVDYIQYDKEANLPRTRRDAGTLFTPKCIYQTRDRLYLFGYNHPDRKLEAVDLRDIADIKLSFKHNNGSEHNKQELDQLFATAEPGDYVAEERRDIIYSGPVVFYCRGQYVGEIYKRFGPPTAPLTKDPRSRVTYTLEKAQICPETLFWLASVEGHGIRVQGPQEAISVVQGYLTNLGSVLTDARLPNRTNNRRLSSENT